MTTPAQPAVASSTDSESAHFHSLESYAWANDNEFQVGLTAILGPNPETSHASQVEDLTLHARCFYYERKFNQPVDFSSYKAWRASQPAEALSPLFTSSVIDAVGSSGLNESTINGIDTTSSSTHGSGPAPPTFAQIMDLIESGKPIPGIQEIPNTVLVGQGTEASRSRRLKPWERA